MSGWMCIYSPTTQRTRVSGGPFLIVESLHGQSTHMTPPLLLWLIFFHLRAVSFLQPSDCPTHSCSEVAPAPLGLARVRTSLDEVIRITAVWTRCQTLMCETLSAQLTMLRFAHAVLYFQTLEKKNVKKEIPSSASVFLWSCKVWVLSSEIIFGRRGKSFWW